MTDDQTAKYGATLLQSPDVGRSKEPSRAIPHAERACDVVRQLMQANQNRHTTSARIRSKLNAERPYNQAELVSKGLGWKHNFSTHPLSALVDRVSPRLVELADGVKYLTDVILPAEYPNATQKTEKFREGFTTLVRGRPEWKSFLDLLTLDDVLFGYTIAGWLDDDGWMPDGWLFDHIFVPDGTPVRSELAQVVCVQEDYLPHELYELIKDRKTAESAGWNFPEVVDALNKGCPDNIRKAYEESRSLENWYANAQRELTVGTSYSTGAQTIVLMSLVVREVTGKVSHYRVSLPDFKLVYSREDRWESMADVFTFFCFQTGNAKLAASKGIGRDLYDLASAQDRARNEIFDRLFISGKTLVQGDPRQVHKFAASVVGAFCIVPNGWTMLTQSVNGDIAPYMQADEYLKRLMDEKVGAVSPKFLQGERVTKAQVELFASREEESRDTRLARFMSQLCDLLSTMQKRACSPKVRDDDAKEFRKRMLAIMSEEEFDILARQRVASTIADLTQEQRQLLVQLATEKRGNPLYNQRALEYEDISARLGPEYAERLLLPDEDPAVVAEQGRTQMLEMHLLATGAPVPVSPRDNHEVHLTVMFPEFEALGTMVAAGQADTKVFEAYLTHIAEHYQGALAAGVPKEKLAPFAKLVQDGQKVLQGLKEIDAQAQQLAAESAATAEADAAAAAVEPGAVPAAPPGQPPM